MFKCGPVIGTKYIEYPGCEKTECVNASHSTVMLMLLLVKFLNP